jgi:3D (Asp-Asp-Asp) domain-containing protein
MRNASILLTTVTLLVTALALPGCAATKAVKSTDGSAPDPQQAAIGRLDDPANLFENGRQAKAKALRVKAMAYTGCSPRKSKRTPRGAWGDPLTRDAKAVAVSPDLLEMGLDRGDVISIEGLPGKYKVLDVMHDRHDKSIDIFYGDDQCGAMQWGKRTLTITWQ